jgi:hypothetical protein
MRVLTLALSAFLVFFMSTIASAANDDFVLLLDKAPSDSNVLALVNAKSIRSSEFYKAAVQSDGAAPFPGLESVNQFVAASRWRMPQGPALYETMIVYLDGISAKQVISQNESAGDASRFPAGTIPVALTGDTLGLYYPADRQAAMRWAESKPAELPSEYLAKGIGYAENNDTQIVFALDLDDSLSSASIRQWIESGPFAGAKQLNAQGAANLIASIHGCTMGIKFTDRAIASWRFDFGGDAKILEPVAKPLMLHLIDRMGLSLASMSGWDTSVNGNSMFIKGELGVSDVRVLLSVLAQSPETLDRLKLSPDTGGSQNASLTKTDASKMQYDMLKKILRDITHPTQSILTSGAKAKYLERYAMKIDELPILNVDEDLLQTTAEIAMRLRVQAERLRGNQIQAGTYSNNSRDFGNDYNNNYYSGYNQSNYGRQYGLTDQQVAQRLGRANSALTGAEQKKEIANMMAELRRTLTQRYQVEF